MTTQLLVELLALRDHWSDGAKPHRELERVFTDLDRIDGRDATQWAFNRFCEDPRLADPHDGLACSWGTGPWKSHEFECIIPAQPTLRAIQPGPDRSEPMSETTDDQSLLGNTIWLPEIAAWLSKILRLLLFFGFLLASVGQSGRSPETDRPQKCGAFTIGVSAIGGCDGIGGPPAPTSLDIARSWRSNTR